MYNCILAIGGPSNKHNYSEVYLLYVLILCNLDQ